MGKGSGSTCKAAGLGDMLGDTFAFVPRRPSFVAAFLTVESVDDTAWEYMLQAWAGNLTALSKDARSALMKVLPEVHNTIFASNNRLGGRCDDYCSLLAHKLQQQGIDVQMVGGLYFDEIYPGTTIHDLEQQVLAGDETDEIFDWGSHTWIELEGNLLDPTAGQFFEGMDSSLWQSQFYLPSQVKNEDFLSGWESGGLPLGSRVIYDSHGIRQKD